MSATILVVDDEDHFRLTVCNFLATRGYEVISVATMADARDCIQQGKADIVLLDVQLPDGYGPRLLDEVAHLALRPPIILITSFGDIDMAVDAMKNGAHDFLQKPIQLNQLEKSIIRALDIVVLRRELVQLRQQQKGDEMLIGSSPQMQTVVNHARRAAEASASVLITGETGTGKEILAKAIHRMGSRSGKGFIAINCAAIQSTMLESELFGYEPGAFTGAEKRKLGLMEVADGGILFLDEIASMPLDMQAKLLRALEENAIRRVGGTNLVHIDVQVLAASNRDLPSMIEQHLFREDLYYRLKVVDLHLPPLRERAVDIPEFVGMFIQRYNQKMGVNILEVTPRALHALVKHTWPGNIRELRNVIERAVLFCDEACLDLPHLPEEFSRLV